jgi:hypothetical protein
MKNTQLVQAQAEINQLVRDELDYDPNLTVHSALKRLRKTHPNLFKILDDADRAATVQAANEAKEAYQSWLTRQQNLAEGNNRVEA